LFSSGFQISTTGELVFGVVTFLMFPVVVKATGVVVVKMNTSVAKPLTGGVTLAIATVPLINVRNPVGTTVAADASVTGFGCNPLWTVDKS